MKVLLAIDSSRASQAVVDEAIARCWPPDTTFCALNVVDLRHWEGLPQLIEDARQSAHNGVAEAADRLNRAERKTTSVVLVGFPGKAITKYAEQWGANLIMAGSRELDAATRFFLGSVMQDLLRTAPCSVEIVRPSSDDLPNHTSTATKVLVATDGSDCSKAAVSSIVSGAWPAGSQFKIISVVELLTPEIESTPCTLAATYPPQLLQDLLDDAEKRAEKAMAEARGVLNNAGLTVLKCLPVAFGDPRSVILDEAKAWKSDLIVLGSHGRHGIDRMVMGSVSESVAFHAHCSVEVIRSSALENNQESASSTCVALSS